ncbi:hypothetical protein CRUP_007309 [Coryphaenoides rupestris]|nr:hypothetical protein CRUP_007309 [Coryphaenoides rupestris]
MNNTTSSPFQAPTPAPGTVHSLLYDVITTPTPGPGTVAMKTQATTVSQGASQATITGGSSLSDVTQDVLVVAADEYDWIVIPADEYDWIMIPVVVVLVVLILVILLMAVLRHLAKIKGSYRTNEGLGEEEEEEEEEDDEACGSDTLLHSNEELEITEDKEKIPIF